MSTQPATAVQGTLRSSDLSDVPTADAGGEVMHTTNDKRRGVGGISSTGYPSDDPALIAGYEAGALPAGPHNFPPGGPELKRVRACRWKESRMEWDGRGGGLRT